MNKEFNMILIDHIKTIAKENKIDPEQVKLFLIDAIKKVFNRTTFENNLDMSINLETGEINTNKIYEVVEDNWSDFDEYLHVEISDPRVKELNLKLGDSFYEPFDITKEFKQNHVQQILQSFKQRITEIANQRVYSSWSQMRNEVILAEIEKENKQDGCYTINLENIYDKNGEKLEPTLGFLGRKDLNHNEVLDTSKKYHFVVINIKEQSKFCPIILSRADVKLVEYYLNLEIPEIDDGSIKIVKAVREAGHKTKVIVDTKTLQVEPAAICVGPRGERIKHISNKLGGEKIEIYNYTNNPYLLLSQIVIKNGIIKMGINEEERTCVLVVMDDELSKAIGKKGINIKLASNLSGYHIDVVKLSDFDPQDYYETFVDIGSNEFKTLINTQRPTNVQEENSNISKMELDQMNDFLDEFDQNNEIDQLNDVFGDEVNQILNDEKEKF